MCVGYLASGKGTFSECLCNSNPRFVRINPDEQGRKSCEKSLGDYIKQDGTIIILNRYNLTR